MQKLILHSFYADRIYYIEIKTDKRYAAIKGKGLWLLILIKCILKIIFKPKYYR